MKTALFTELTMKGQLGTNAIAANKHLYDINRIVKTRTSR
jgi:hypothetical protein